MIRPIATDDRPAIESLRSRLEYSDRELLNAAIDGPFLGRVAENADEVVGYAIGLSTQTTSLSELVVDPKHRREGYGRKLVESIVTASAGDRIVVTTPIENAAATRFYLELGFERDERLCAFYDDGTDALRLVRRE